MKKKNTILFLITLVVITIIMVYSFQGGETAAEYVERIKEVREEKNDHFKTSEESPLSDEMKQQFDKLTYFTPDPAYKVTARLRPINSQKLMVLPTSDGKEKKYVRYAMASFSLQGKELQVLLLKSMEDDNPDRLFLPFKDKTNGDETYGGGRYLDLELRRENQITIDFNLAYNPYCAYSSGYSCPLPPSENYLDIPVPAGEKSFSAH